MKEFDLIRRVAELSGPGGAGVRLGIGDDGAVLQVPPGRELVAVLDTLNEGVHFPAATHPADIGHKALAVNLSDLAAMGAEPRWALLSLSLGEVRESWLDDFLKGFLSLARRFGVSLVGGDTCSGPMSLSVTALGLAPASGAMKRSGARPGDLVVLSGSTGAAGLALRHIRAGNVPPPSLADALNRPEPRVVLGQILAGQASACIDISDGLVADLGHLADASGCGARVELASLPCPAALGACTQEDRWGLQLASGDDYELLFTLAASRAPYLPDLSRKAGVPLTVIGRMVEGGGVVCTSKNGRPFTPSRVGYEHFE